MNEPPVTIVHRNPWFAVSHRHDISGSEPMDWFRVERADSVIVIPVVENGRIAMIRGRRDTVGDGRLVELPSGGIDRNETAAAAAIRELREETGLVAAELLTIGVFVEAPGISASRCHVFEARKLQAGTSSLESGEKWVTEFCTRGEIEWLQSSGQIMDGSTLAALQLWAGTRNRTGDQG